MKDQQHPSASRSSSWLYSELLLELSKNGVRRGRSTALLTLQLISMQEMETSQLPPRYISHLKGDVKLHY